MRRRDPQTMSAEARLAEVADILAVGLRRLRLRRQEDRESAQRPLAAEAESERSCQPVLNNPEDLT